MAKRIAPSSRSTDQHAKQGADAGGDRPSHLHPTSSVWRLRVSPGSRRERATFANIAALCHAQRRRCALPPRRCGLSLGPLPPRRALLLCSKICVCACGPRQWCVFDSFGLFQPVAERLCRMHNMTPLLMLFSSIQKETASPMLMLNDSSVTPTSETELSKVGARFRQVSWPSTSRRVEQMRLSHATPAPSGHGVRRCLPHGR